MPASAYYVPTYEATLTAAAGRGLQGLGCGCGASCKCGRHGDGMGQLPIPGMFPGAAAIWSAKRKLGGYALPPALAWYMPGTRSPALLDGLGAGAASGRFNRSISRGIYELPFVGQGAQGSAGLGQLDTTGSLLIGISAVVIGLALMGVGGKRIRRHNRRRARLGAAA